MGLRESKFSHYLFDAGENRGEPLTFLSKSELWLALNIEHRGRGLETRLGSIVVNTSGGVPAPVDATAEIASIHGIEYGEDQSDALFSIDDSVYRDPGTPTALDSGFSPGVPFHYEDAAGVFHMTNGIDPVMFYQPSRSDAQLYSSGYDTPGAFTATEDGAGVMGVGTYGYYVTLYDETTNTESNRQATAVTVAIAASKKVLLEDLPLDSESRTTHWRIYRKDPSGFAYYRLDQIVYDSGDPTYEDNTAQTGTLYLAPNDNDKPDLSVSIAKHGSVMVYAGSNVITWSKPGRHQNVPTYNREPIQDSSARITKVVSFKGAVLIFLTRTIWIIRGDLATGAYVVKQISKKAGCVSPATIQVGADGVFFFASDGRPRMLTATDFDAEDLRDSTDISYKFRDRFAQLDDSKYANFFAVLWHHKQWSQYRLFVIEASEGDACNFCYVFDYGLLQRNGGQSSWFRHRYGISAKCGDVVVTPAGLPKTYLGDDFTLIWSLDETDTYFDGDEFEREEDGADLTFGASSIQVDSAGWAVNQFRGMQVILYDEFTFDEIFRSKIASNTADTLTTVDPVPTLSTSNPYITIGGYFTVLGTAHFSQDRSGRCRPLRLSLLLDQTLGSSLIYGFVNYDYNESFNKNYDYFNNTLNPSVTPRSDIYPVAVGGVQAVYNAATSLYGTSRYGAYNYDTADILLKNTYLFSSAWWGLITRAPSSPFRYLGSTLRFQYKAVQGGGVPQ